MGGLCSTTTPRVDAQLLESQEPRSDKQVGLGVSQAPRSGKLAALDGSMEPRSDKPSALDVERTEIRSAPRIEGGPGRTVEQVHTMVSIERRDTDPFDADIDHLTLPYRIFLRGAMIGCAIVAVPMAVLIWIVVSNGILYRFYPLPDTQRER